MLKTIVKEVIQLDAQYWLLLDVPKQDKQEQVNVYVLRACAVLEKSSDTRQTSTTDSSKSQAAQQAEEEAREKERKARLEGEGSSIIFLNQIYSRINHHSYFLEAATHITANLTSVHTFATTR